MIAVDVLTTREELVSLRPRWLELWEASGADIFSDFDWQFAWWETLGRGQSPLVLRAREGGETVGIAPFMLAGPSRERLAFLAAPMCDYCDIIVPERRPDVIAALLDEYLALDRMWARSRLERVAKESAAGDFMSLAMERGLPHIQSVGEERFAYEATPEDIAAVAAGQIKQSGKRPSTHFRKHTALERTYDAEEIRRHLPNIFTMHARRWQYTQTPSQFHSPAARAFFHRVVDSLAPRGHLSLCVMSYLGEPVGYALDLHRDRSCYRYTLAHSPYYVNESPGRLLGNRGSRELLAAGFTRIDYLRGSEIFKQTLSNTSYRTCDLELFREPLLHGMVRLNGALRRSDVGRWIRSKPYLRTARKRLLGRLPDETAFGLQPASGELYEVAASEWPAVEWEASAPPLESLRATVDQLPLLGDLYGCAAGSPQIERMRGWLEAGATCLLVKAGVAPLAAGWVFDCRMGSRGPICPQAAPEQPVSGERVSLLCHMTDSPAAPDSGAVAALLQEYLSSWCADGHRSLIHAPSRVLAPLLPADVHLRFIDWHPGTNVCSEKPCPGKAIAADYADAFEAGRPEQWGTRPRSEIQTSPGPSRPIT